ncbi:hypothetical protein BO86DRAFT_401057 [Aspergillus japonicus CBS 114.51]|uniref:C2H2-type domain-containing protein n=1 Tax=Aspergillus japonicus CBS 114.51 TaxID=1448312 RepID=A0A8T8WX96_ASPJA|nr:hypothetical protein BO86DRAFT_401057 [Aspergillus japonicus CBS 114.51]RAH80284.1 hypothetical protein BO86DRAFT_401057 [Aspergillus japonicus CBS 114.51]
MSRFTTIRSLYGQAQICDAMLQELVNDGVQRTLSFADVHDTFRRFVKESRFLTSKKASVRYQAKHPATMDLFTYLFRLMRVNLMVLLVKTAPRVTFLRNVYNSINKMRVHLLRSDARGKGHGKHRPRRHEDPSMFSVLDADNNDVTSKFKDFVSRIIKQMFPCVDSKLRDRLGTRLVDSRIAIGYHQHKHGRRAGSSMRKTSCGRVQRSRAMPDVFTWPPMPQTKEGEPNFRCPYCMVYFPVGEFDAVRWEDHVLQDVRPYLCLWGSCSSVFGSMKAWIKHMGDHRRASASEQAHPIEQCPFCGLREGDHGARRHGNEGLLRHIAGHLDDLALLALPGPMDKLLEMHIQGRRIGIEPYEHANDARGRQRSRSRSELLAARTSAVGDAGSRSPSPLLIRDRDSMMVEIDRSSIRGGDPEGDPEEHLDEQERAAEYERNPFINPGEESQEDDVPDEEPEDSHDLHPEEEDHAANDEEEPHEDQPEEEVQDSPEGNPLELQEERPHFPEEDLDNHPAADPEVDQEEDSKDSDAEEQDRASSPEDDDDDEDPEAEPSGEPGDGRRANRTSKIPKLKKRSSPKDETRESKGSRIPRKVSPPVQNTLYKSLFN